MMELTEGGMAPEPRPAGEEGVEAAPVKCLPCYQNQKVWVLCKWMQLLTDVNTPFHQSAALPGVSKSTCELIPLLLLQDETSFPWKPKTNYDTLSPGSLMMMMMEKMMMITSFLARI